MEPKEIKLIFEKIKAHKIYLEYEMEKAEKSNSDLDYIQGAIDCTDFMIALFDNTKNTPIVFNA